MTVYYKNPTVVLQNATVVLENATGITMRRFLQIKTVQCSTAEN